MKVKLFKKLWGKTHKELIEENQSLKDEVSWLYDEIKEHQEFQRKVSAFIKDVTNE